MLGAHLDAPSGMPWTVGIVAKATQAYELGYGSRYDAVLIDEGQDFTRDWWDLLHNSVLTDDGETLVAVDPTQDIYDRGSAGCDERRRPRRPNSRAAGGVCPARRIAPDAERPPRALRRLRRPLTSTATSSRRRPCCRTTPVRSEPGSTSTACRSSDRPSAARSSGCCEEYPDAVAGDISFVCDYHHDGVAAVRVIEAAGIPVHHIFSRDPDAPRRRRKHRFWPDVARSRRAAPRTASRAGSRLRSSLGIGADDRARRLAYVAMTRDSVARRRLAGVRVGRERRPWTQRVRLPSSSMGLPSPPTCRHPPRGPRRRAHRHHRHIGRRPHRHHRRLPSRSRRLRSR